MVLKLCQQAKEAKDWATSDEIRDALAEAGFEVKDTKDGVTWKLIRYNDKRPMQPSASGVCRFWDNEVHSYFTTNFLPFLI